jgi:methionyl-tRNA formyltransferase
LDSITPRRQVEENATFAPLLTKEDGVIDWISSASEIERGVRGFQPWPNAYTKHHGKRLIIWKAEAIRATDIDAAPGKVIEAHGDDLVVAAGNKSALRIRELQPESKRRMTVRDFLNGTHLKVGESFGEV